MNGHSWMNRGTAIARSGTISRSGHRVAATRRRRSTSSSSGTLTRKGRIAIRLDMRSSPIPLICRHGKVHLGDAEPAMDRRYGPFLFAQASMAPVQRPGQYPSEVHGPGTGERRLLHSLLSSGAPAGRRARTNRVGRPDACGAEEEPCPRPMTRRANGGGRPESDRPWGHGPEMVTVVVSLHSGSPSGIPGARLGMSLGTCGRAEVVLPGVAGPAQRV